MLLRPRMASGAGATVTFLDKPQNVSAVAQDAQSILVDWDAVAGASSYIVERYNPLGVTVMTDIVTTQYLDHDLEASTTYGYRVRAVP